MALKRIADNPSITDTILLEVVTAPTGGCPSDPYKIDTVTVYMIQKDFAQGSYRVYQRTDYQRDAEEAAARAQVVACDSPTQENIDKAAQLRAIADSTSTTSDLHYASLVPVKSWGNPDYPAWLSTDTGESEFFHDRSGPDGILIGGTELPGEEQPGMFLVEWTPSGEAREGDYLICWTWTPNPAGDSMTAHMPFSIKSDVQAYTSIPSHYTDPRKYPTLLDRYTPEMFKMYISDTDLTPDIMELLNLSIGDGYSLVEDLANQIIDTLDANSTHESLLSYLSNLFNLKLKSQDPTLWRRQIKRAIPLFKKKGTLSGLSEAFEQAGMKLKKFTGMYQVSSPYTHVDSFFIEEDGQETFRLTREMILPLDPNNFELAILATSSREYQILPNSSASFATTSGVTDMTWQGGFELEKGDILRVLYKDAAIPPGKQSIEDYIRSLPEADQRSEERRTDDEIASNSPERLKLFPLKNWNIKVIEEDDILFDSVCSCLDSFQYDLVFGWIRTEFPFSENIYNMDEYNGSSRESKEPCDIDRDFLDSCSCCKSSKYSIDLEIDDLSDDRILEALEVISENAPFHSVLHTMNIGGSAEDFSLPPVESVETLIKYDIEDVTISGQANSAFHRARGTGFGDPTMAIDGADTTTFNQDVLRDMLASFEEVPTSGSAIGFNRGISLYTPASRLDRIGLSPNNVLEVISPSFNAGRYTLSAPTGNTASVSGRSEPFSGLEFTFNLSNIVYSNPSVQVIQDDLKYFSDPSKDWGSLPIKSLKDFSLPSGSSIGGIGITEPPWSISIPAYSAQPFMIREVMPDGRLLLEDPSGILPIAASGISYQIKNGTEMTIPVDGSNTWTTGNISAGRRGRVEVNDVNLIQVEGFLKIGDYAAISGSEYPISGFVPNTTNQFYIADYSSGSLGGFPMEILRRLLSKQRGNFAYRGLYLNTIANMESILNIQNGQNAPADPNLIVDTDPSATGPRFFQEFLIVIDGNYYFISDINANIVSISGPMYDWGTQASGGTQVSYSVLRFTKTTTSLSGGSAPLNIDGQEFPFIDRDGNDDITYEEELTNLVLSVASVSAQMNQAAGNRSFSQTSQHESVEFSIEYREVSDEVSE